MRGVFGLIIGSLFTIMDVFGFLPSAFAQNLEVLKAGVVKITTTTGQIGTGFIVRVESDVVYIMTAAHVIAGENQPKVEFFTNRNRPVRGEVLPGAEVNDDIRGLALVIVRGKDQIPHNATSLPFQTSSTLVSGGEEVGVIGHPGGGGDWAVVTRNISNRVGRDLTLDPGMASRFSGGPIIVGEEVVGIVMSNRGEFGLGITHKSVLNFMEGFDAMPSNVLIENETISSSDFTRSPLDRRSQGGMGTLVIESTPKPAQVFVDDEYIGNTGSGPVVVRNLEPDEYDVMVTKEGFRSWTRTINLEAGERQTLSATLQQGQELGVTGVWKNPAEPTITYVLTQEGNRVTMTEVTTSLLGTVVTAQGEGQLKGNQLGLMYRTALGTMGQSSTSLSNNGQQLVGTFQDFSNMIPVAISLMRTGDVPQDFSLPGTADFNSIQNFGQ